MQCPPEIAAILSDILTTGLLRIRMLGWDHHAQRCAVEADHLHNLPRLLVEFKSTDLEYYWHAERASYINQSNPDEIRSFEHLWNALAKHVDAQNEPALAG